MILWHLLLLFERLDQLVVFTLFLGVAHHFSIFVKIVKLLPVLESQSSDLFLIALNLLILHLLALPGTLLKEVLCFHPLRVVVFRVLCHSKLQVQIFQVLTVVNVVLKQVD